MLKNAFWKLPYIQISLGPRIYTFEKFDSGVSGDNFVTKLCELPEFIPAEMTLHNVHITCDDTFEVRSDIDFVLFLFKRARGDKFGQYVTKSDVIFLYEFYKTHGFEFMCDEVLEASDRLFPPRCVVS